eukprot:g4335.t1
MPLVGIGTNRYGAGTSDDERAPLLAAVKKFAELGGKLIDTAPSYRGSEEDQLSVMRDWKQDGKVRYCGITTSRTDQYEAFAEVMRSEDLDTIQVAKQFRMCASTNGNNGTLFVDDLLHIFGSIIVFMLDKQGIYFHANSEHCRHKIFNASWTIDGEDQDKSLFAMIKNTYKEGGEDVLSAYADNASVVVGAEAGRFLSNPDTGVYRYEQENIHLLMKVETHNHPTAIAPFAGAGTGSGGEIRDEGAVGRGSKPKVGLCGFTVSNLQIPEYEQPWEQDYGKPERIVTALDIMLEGPIGAAAFNNEFGRPNLCGYFRTFEADFDGQRRGYHKPIMIAGGYGNIRAEHVDQHEFEPGCKLIVLGGPAMLIGLGGGAASSMTSGASDADLDFASVQRQNPEMQRRCQEVIDSCCALGTNNPIAFIHDVGAGGLSNALPELVKDGGTGGRFDLRKIPNDEPGMSPVEIWCNEAQERYVLAVRPDDLPRFEAICKRERAIYAVVGESTAEDLLSVDDSLLDDQPVDLPMSVLFGKPPKMHRQAVQEGAKTNAFDTSVIDLAEAINRVLGHPTVANKSFLITIGDRSITGQVVRDQMVGPWQIPVADCAVTTAGFDTYAGEAMSMGERTPYALIDAPVSGRMAIGEALTNIAATRIDKLSDIKLSANWMAASGHDGEDEKLFRTVETVGMEICPALGLTIPVGKDSMSMRTAWQEEGAQKSVTAPLSLIISVFTPVVDVRKTLTPVLEKDRGETQLLLIDLGAGQNRLGGSILAQAYNQMGSTLPDLDSPPLFKAFFSVIQALLEAGLLLAYHDRSDGGLLATLSEMAFASRCGLDIHIGTEMPVLETLFAEELGAVVQVASENINQVMSAFADAGLSDQVGIIAQLNDADEIRVFQGEKSNIYSAARAELQQTWSEVSFRIQSMRDNPASAQQEFERIAADDPGLSAVLGFDPANLLVDAPALIGSRPRIAILREQGVNGQLEMAAAFDRAGFEAVDVHMSDLIAGRHALSQFAAMVACGGFSYGDVLGAGEDVQQVLVGEAGVIQAVKPGALVIDMSTIDVQATRELADRFQQQGVTYLDAPVSGGEKGAINAELTIFVGGAVEAFESAMPVFSVLGKTITYMGPVGAGQAAKACNQILVSAGVMATAEALNYGLSEGLDLQALIQAASGGSAQSWILTNLGAAMANRDFSPGFMIDLMQKDLQMLIASAQQEDIPVPVAELASETFGRLQERGLGEEGMQAIAKAYSFPEQH